MDLEFKVKKGLENISFKQFRPILQGFVKHVKDMFGDDLVSIVVFGSVGRGDCTENSDIDMIVVVRNLPKSFFKRINLFIPIIEKVRRNTHSRVLIQIYPLTVGEASKNRPLYLDMLTDAVILYDKNHFMEGVLRKLWRKLKSLGTRKVRLKNGSWLWILKPDIKLGEVVEI